MDAEQIRRNEYRTLCIATLAKVAKLFEEHLTAAELNVFCQELDGGGYSIAEVLNPINERLQKVNRKNAKLNADPWFVWNGDNADGPFPDRNTIVEVEFRDGFNDSGPAYQWNWFQYNDCDDIVSYRQSPLNKA